MVDRAVGGGEEEGGVANRTVNHAVVLKEWLEEHLRK